MHTYRFPAESPEYRAARDELLAAERDLRAQVERVAAMRRKLPPGGLVPEDYAFVTSDASSTSGTSRVKLSELFAPGRDTLLLYGFMYGPEMKAPCPMCTAFLDGLEGTAPHLLRRVSLAVVAKSPIAEVKAYARSRGWGHLRMLSWGGTHFGRDYHCETPGGGQNTILHVFTRRPDGVHHFWSTELNLMPAEPGQNHRHLDMMWSLWNLLDATPEGRGSDWYPAIEYDG
ncbi:MAG: DUF899 family protein [Polyangiaceae bacterium]|jgi:predicted dithiol-disulfide oxidoreductase (DUF899 family)